MTACKTQDWAYTDAVFAGTMTEEARLLLDRLDRLESKLETILESLGSRESEQWIDRKGACRLLGISDSHLLTLIAKGTIKGDSIRNVGTAKKARYRFHRVKLLNQYLARA